MSKRVLITGISGFIGSHLLEHVLMMSDWEVVGIASWQHKGLPSRINRAGHYQEQKQRVTIITHDLNVPFTPDVIEEIGEIDYIFNLASESHVQRSIDNPVPFVQNNVNLMLNMLELARILKPKLFLQFSTDEVYGAAPDGVQYKEWDTAKPSNPYAASKAAQEAIAQAYWRTYGVPVVITNCMNVFGERQDKEKFVAMLIQKINNGETLTIHGSTGNIGSRFYLHARNISDAVLWIASRTTPTMYDEDHDRPDKYHIAGEIEIDNLSLAQKVAELMDKPLNYKLEEFHASRPGHDRRYALNGAKLKQTGWVQPVNFEESLRKTIEHDTK